MKCKLCGREIGEDAGDCFNPNSVECYQWILFMERTRKQELMITAAGTLINRKAVDLSAEQQQLLLALEAVLDLNADGIVIYRYKYGTT